MPITHDVLQTLICCIDEEGHIIEEPVLLPCGHNACKKCVDLTNKKPFECFNDDCNQIFQLEDEHPYTNNRSIEMLLKTYIKDLFAIIQEKVKDTINEFENLDYEKKIDKNCDVIAKEINSKVESLKTELDSINYEFQQHVKNLKVKLKKLIPNSELESMRNYMHRMHNQPMPTFENLYEYQSRLKSVKQTVKEFSKVNIYPLFEVSETTVEKSLIGNLNVSSYNCYMIKKRILMGSVKFVDLKHKPTRICSVGKTMLCVSHSEANKINVYSNNFDFIKSIDKIGNYSLNNPTGIASDGRRYIYICDTGNNRILLCNLKFNLIEKFDEATLGEYEINRPTDIHLHDYFIYVSDNLGARIHKFTTDMSYIESYDVNVSPFQIAVLKKVIFVSDQESHSSHFYNQDLFPSSNQNSRTGSINEDEDGIGNGNGNEEAASYAESSQQFPCLETYDNEGPICTVDNNFVQWNKFTKVFHFYDHEGKLESSLRLKNLIKTEIKKKQFRRARLYKHEKFQSNRRLQLIKAQAQAKAAAKKEAPSFDRVTRENFSYGNTKKKFSAQSQFHDDLCYFNGKLVITYFENKLVIV